jgi:hypothetical protein
MNSFTLDHGLLYNEDKHLIPIKTPKAGISFDLGHGMVGKEWWDGTGWRGVRCLRNLKLD